MTPLDMAITALLGFWERKQGEITKALGKAKDKPLLDGLRWHLDTIYEYEKDRLTALLEESKKPTEADW